MSDIIWEQPPQAAFDAKVISKSKYGELAVALRSHKDKWARVDRDFASENSAKNTAQNMRRGQVKGFIAGEYEVLCHDKVIWVCYTGPKEPTVASRKVDLDGDDSVDEDERKAFPAKVRAWAKLKGRDMSAHGRLPEHLIAAYEEDTGESRPATLAVVK